MGIVLPAGCFSGEDATGTGVVVRGLGWVAAAGSRAAGCDFRAEGTAVVRTDDSARRRRSTALNACGVRRLTPG